MEHETLRSLTTAIIQQKFLMSFEVPRSVVIMSPFVVGVGNQKYNKHYHDDKKYDSNDDNCGQRRRICHIRPWSFYSVCCLVKYMNLSHS